MQSDPAQLATNLAGHPSSRGRICPSKSCPLTSQSVFTVAVQWCLCLYCLFIWSLWLCVWRASHVCPLFSFSPFSPSLTSSSLCVGWEAEPRGARRRWQVVGRFRLMDTFCCFASVFVPVLGVDVFSVNFRVTFSPTAVNKTWHIAIFNPRPPCVWRVPASVFWSPLLIPPFAFARSMQKAIKQGAFVLQSADYFNAGVRVLIQKAGDGNITKQQRSSREAANQRALPVELFLPRLPLTPIRTCELTPPTSGAYASPANTQRQTHSQQLSPVTEPDLFPSSLAQLHLLQLTLARIRSGEETDLSLQLSALVSTSRGLCL